MLLVNKEKGVKTMPGENTEHQSMLDSIENPVIALNQELKVSYCNPAYARAAGLKVGEMLGRYLLEIFSIIASICSVWYSSILPSSTSWFNFISQGKLPR